MSNLHKLLLTTLCGLAAAGASFTQSPVGTAEATETVVTFKFVPGQDMFYIPWGGNDAELNHLYALVDKYRAEIAAGRMPVYVDGYSGSMRSAERNAELAFIRANRVKSELITQKGLAEDNFVTKNYATAYTGADGIAHKDMVVVTLRIPAKAEQPRRPEPVEESGREEPAAVVERQPEPVVEQKPEPQAQAQPQVQPQAPAAPAKPYCLAVRTNLLYDAFLLPTLGVEWRVSRSVGVKLDASGSYWGGPHGKVQKMWMLSPEVPWYLTPARRLYAGVWQSCDTTWDWSEAFTRRCKFWAFRSPTKRRFATCSTVW